MRKVSSAPSLVEVGKKASLDYLAGPRLGSKSSSASSLVRVGGLSKEDNKRQALKVKTRALHSEAQPLAAPPDQVLPEEFAESAKGLAGMDCFELYGGSKRAPALQAGADGSVPEAPQSQADTDDANSFALASCLNTPYTGEDKNLGELVDSQARGQVEAAVTRLEAKYEKEVSTQVKDEMGSNRQELAETRTTARRRRLMEMLGLLTPEGEGEEGLSPEDRSDIAHLLMTSLDDEGTNRKEAPREWKQAGVQPLLSRRTVSLDRSAKGYGRQAYYRGPGLNATSY